MRFACLLCCAMLLAVMLCAGFMLAVKASPADAGAGAAPSAAEDVRRFPAESAYDFVKQSTGGPFSGGKLRPNCPDGNCPGGVCHRHEEELQVKVEMQPQPAADTTQRHPLAVPLLVFAIVMIVGGGMYFGGWLSH